MKNLILYPLLTIFFFSCTKGEVTKVDVDPEFEPYVQSFIEEAAKRGVTIDFEKTGLSMQFGETPPNSNGVCTGLREDISSTHEIIIQRNRWDGDNEFDKERLIFHELGHCHLLRGHIIDTLVSGEWKSIMRGDTPESYGYRSFNMTGIRRDYYIDELFDKSSAAPDWVNINADYNTIPAEKKELLFEVENVNSLFRSTDLSDNFEIELVFILTEDFTRNSLGFLWGGFGVEQSMRMSLSGFSLFIVNTLEGYGVLRAFETFDGLRLGQPVKMTVQKIADKYYYFVNERFLYWADFEPLLSNTIEINNSNTNYQISSLTVKRLEKG